MRRRPFRAFTVRLDMDLANAMTMAQAKQLEDSFNEPINWSDVVRRALEREAVRVLAR